MGMDQKKVVLRCKVHQILRDVFGWVVGNLHFCNSYGLLCSTALVFMKIILVCDSKMPVSPYDDDKERIVWELGRALVRLGHEVCFLVRKGSVCDFAQVLICHEKKPLEDQIPMDADIVHFQEEPRQEISKPYVITQHDNSTKARTFDQNTVFLSDSHARLHGGSVFVYPGLNFSAYATPELGVRRSWFHFLGNASKRGRNVRGAIDLASKVDTRLHVIGGSRVHFRQGLRIPLSPSARFHGALSPDGRDALLNASKGMIFPVLWEEPFSLGVVESLYFGCPIFGTPYGAMPELLGKKVVLKDSTAPISGSVDAFFSDYGCLSVRKTEILEAIRNADDFDRIRCHEYAVEKFSAQRMAEDYLKLYAQVIRGKPLHAKAPMLQQAPSDKLMTIS
jgi:glycosyltransferase involved in cell wall biosynthesis